LKKIILLLANSALLLTGCSHYYYISNVQNVPLFSEKKELVYSGGTLLKYQAVSAEFQGAYALTDKFAVSMAFMHITADYDKNWGKGSYYEGAAGYYKPQGKHGVFELYGGIGASKQYHRYRSDDLYFDTIMIQKPAGTSNMKFIKLFIQPSYGWKYKSFEIALSSRICNLSFFDINNKIVRSENQREFLNLNDIEKNKNFFFFEPAITIRFGLKNIKIQFQGLVDSYLNNGRNHFDECHLSLGLSGRFKLK
jgi:hypothetical protein